MTTRPIRHRPHPGVASLLGLLLAMPALAARDDTRQGATKPQEPVTAPPDASRDDAPRRERTESLRQPSGETRPNPEQTNPALVNPCHGSPQPKWCGE